VTKTSPVPPPAARAPDSGGIGRPIYLDCNATTPLEPEVRAEVLRYLDHEFGNAGSRTHGYGQAAKERVNQARSEVAGIVDAQPEEVIFTSGATESNNLALLGLVEHGSTTGRRHIVSTLIEHKAILEPLDELRTRGFEIDLVAPTAGGWVDPAAIHHAMRPDTLLISVMAANNETGVIQPLNDIARALGDHEAYLHVDAAQLFGKALPPLRNHRIDLISISAHKLYGPKGIGALVGRRRGFQRPPLRPLMFGGGQERGLRPGTQPVHLIAGLGAAAALAARNHEDRERRCLLVKQALIEAFAPLDPTVNGEVARSMAHTINLAIPGLDSEAVMLATKDLVAISNGSACTSQRYEPSHVLIAMGASHDAVSGALRISWSHLTPDLDWHELAKRIAQLRSAPR
jgi:cysteine desulfurase